MLHRRLSIGRLMTWVAVIAANFGAFRLLFATRQLDILGGGLLAWVAFQIGAIRAYRGAGRARAFWVGFVTAGSLVALSLIAAVTDSSSILTKAWMSYAALYERSAWLNVELENLLARTFGNPWGELAVVPILTALEFLPVAIAAIAGGLLARTLPRLGRARTRRVVLLRPASDHFE